MTADTDRPADANAVREVVGRAMMPWHYSEWDDGAECDQVADAVLAALSAAGLTVVPTESLPEWRCPSCGAVTRARMADAPTGAGAEQAGPGLGEASLGAAALAGEQLPARRQQTRPAHPSGADRVEQLTRASGGDSAAAYAYTAADRPANVRKSAHPAFGVAELTDLERRMQGILDPDDAIEAVFVALGWLAHALPAAGLVVVPAGEVEQAWRKLGGPDDDVHHIPHGHEPVGRSDWEQVERHAGPWRPVDD